MPARNAPGPQGDGFRRSRVHLTRGPGPQGRRHMGPTSRIHPQTPERARRETEEARPDGAGALPGGTGHLRQRPADQRVQETTPHPPRCAATAGVVGRGRFVGRGGRGRRWRWSSTAWPREVGEVAGESSTMVVVMPWNDEAKRRGSGGANLSRGRRRGSGNAGGWGARGESWLGPGGHWERERAKGI